MKCKVIANKDSGNFERLDIDALMSQIGCAQLEIFDSDSNWNADGFDTIVVCGGDGTLHNALQQCKGKQILYVPCGTLNETAFREERIHSLCAVNGKPFAYVCAAGSFTQIGYTAKTRSKKQCKALAYLPQVAKHFCCHNIFAKLQVDSIHLEGNFTLLMVLKSRRCFGFDFNKDYDHTGKNYLLAINSPGKDCFVNRVKMFFPFFRVFFCGATPCVKRNWMLLPFDKLTMTLPTPQDFCIDGEKRCLGGQLHFETLPVHPPIAVVKNPPLLPRRS